MSHVPAILVAQAFNSDENLGKGWATMTEKARKNMIHKSTERTFNSSQCQTTEMQPPNSTVLNLHTVTIKKTLQSTLAVQVEVENGKKNGIVQTE
jgi:hypothetical protein